jgi:dCTP deaminase
MTGRERPKLADKTSFTWRFALERVTGIEPALSAWEADVLPLNYTRASAARPVAATTEAGCAVFAQTSYRTGWVTSVILSDRGIKTEIASRAGQA